MPNFFGPLCRSIDADKTKSANNNPQTTKKQQINSSWQQFTGHVVPFSSVGFWSSKTISGIINQTNILSHTPESRSGKLKNEALQYLDSLCLV